MMKLWMIRALSNTLISSPHTRARCASTFALKNVTRLNFDSALKDLRSLIRDADFVAIDLEMTGVTSAPWRESFEFDRYDIRYLKVKDSAEKFAVIQFGVCPFRWDSVKKFFIAHPHNFYIFPRQEVPGSDQSYEFLCQTTSLDFLAKYQFDFNTCLSEGISYLSRIQETAALKRLSSVCLDDSSESLSGSKKDEDFQFSRMVDVLFAERMKIKIREWRDGLLHDSNNSSIFPQTSDNPDQRFQTIFFKTRPAFVLNGFTSHQKKLIQMVTEKHFNDLAFVRVTDEETLCQRQLVVYTDSNEDRDLLMKEVKDCLLNEAKRKVKSAVGFRKVIDLLSSEKKLVVGHNCFLDFAHIYGKFIGPLPWSAEEYASSLRNYFPYIMDTKVLLNANDTFRLSVKKSSTSLSNAFASLCPGIASGVKGPSLVDKLCVQVEVHVDEQRSLDWNSGAKHEAGYDAFMTGCIFAEACNRLGVDFGMRSTPLGLADEKKLENYINLLYLSWASGDIIDLRTGKRNTDCLASSTTPKTQFREVDFQNIVLLWGLQPTLKPSGIRECISRVFSQSSVSSIYLIDKTAAFVQFSKTETAAEFLGMMETLRSNNGPISVLHPLSKLLEGGCTRAANYEVYREICISPLSKVLFADQAEAVKIKEKSRSGSLKSNAEEGMVKEDERLGMKNSDDNAFHSSDEKEQTSFAQSLR
ncbi:unnamed protein product [Cuscuta epithymum]|uniref:Uncharacterized protein n=1 Tax=Cuscuta epithymum TaxID=186058 RepID=A0AAV0DRG4_9ASTE|nr:unnamed protein product [Cuscuta epithymum]